MVLPGHLAGGYIATTAILTSLDPNFGIGQTTFLYILGTLAGDFPDIDIALHAISSYKNKSDIKASHREYPTHAPSFWLAVCLAISAIGAIVGSLFVVYVGLIVLTGTWSHFILDSFEYGIRWLWPFSRKRFYLLDPGEDSRPGKPHTFSFYWDYIRRGYIKKFTFYLEIFITFFALYILLFS